MSPDRDDQKLDESVRDGDPVDRRTRSDQKIRVLVVDDDQIDRRAVRRAIGDRYTILEAEDGPQALRMLQTDKPACVLLDYNIPGTNTLKLLAELGLHVPVVMLTGEGDEEVAVRVMKAGAQDYLVKNGFTPESLEAAIGQAIDKFHRHRQQTEARERLRSEYQQEKQKRSELETALQIARDIQQNLIPSQPPDVPGFDIAGVYLPAQETGGDFYDYVSLADGTCGIVIADVSGHGIGSALLAADTRAYVRALARNDHDIGRIATITNRLLWEDLTSERFVTFFLAKLNPVERTVTFAAAGHPAYVIHASGEWTTLASESLPLGLLKDATIVSSQPVSLQSGDILFLATDGLFETFPPLQTLFGKDRCLRLIHAHRTQPAEKIIDRLIQVTRVFAHLVPPHDDVTIVIAKWK